MAKRVGLIIKKVGNISVKDGKKKGKPKEDDTTEEKAGGK